MDLLLIIYEISVFIAMLLLLIDMLVCIYNFRFHSADVVGSIIIAVVAMIPIAQWIITGWLIKDIIKELKT